MAMLNRLGDRIALQTEHGIITHTADDAVAALFFNYPDSMGSRSIGGATRYAQTHRLSGEGPARRIVHSVAGLVPGDAYAVEVLDLEHGNVAEAWHRLGEPLNLSPQQVADLSAIADALDRSTVTVSADGVLEIDITLAPWAVLSISRHHP